MLLKPFLDLILADSGLRCFVKINKNKNVKQTFVSTNEELAAEIEATSVIEGLNLYHACATYKDDSSRRGHNALMCKSFWLDVDCGEGKPYADAKTGISALDEFANRLDLPLPLCVHSGSGIHAYWPLTESIPAAVWAETSRMLKHTAKMCGLHVDPSRTADVASILRSPGTTNYKRTAEPVAVDDSWGGEIIEAGEFKSRLIGYGQTTSLPTVAARTATSLLIPPVKNSSISAGISGGCPSMTQGYPDGERTDALAKRAGYLLATGRSYEETLAACRAWNEYNTPPLPDEKLTHDVGSYAKREATKPKPSTPTIEPAEPAPIMAYPYRLNPVTGALEKQSKDENQNIVWSVLSPYTLYLKEVCRRESVDKGAYVFRQWHPHNGWHEFTVSTGDMEGSNWRAIMHENCANIVDKDFKFYINHMAIHIKGLNMDTLQYEQFGWKDNDTAFLVGNTLFKNDGSVRIAYGVRNIEERMKAMDIPPNSSLEKWSAAANKFFQPGFEALGFGLVAGFAAPLIKFCCGNTDGGALLALFSEDTGYGKSKILEGISSIWGKYDALSTTGKDTVNAKFGIITTACHLPVYEEELRERDPVIAANFIKDFTMGRDKNRAQKDGSVQYKNSRYQTIMVSASNLSLLRTVEQSGDKGAVARIFELSIDMPQGLDFKYLRNISNEMQENCGHAGRALGALLMRPYCVAYIKREIALAEQEYILKLETQPEHRFIVWIMAACKVISPLLVAAGILSFDPNRVMAWAEEKAKERIGTKSAVDTVGAEAVAALSRYINENWMAECLVVAKEFNAKQPTQILQMPSHRLSMRMERDSYRLYIALDPLKKWLIRHNVDYTTLLNKLKVREVVLDAKKTVTLGAGTGTMPGRVPCWEVDTNHPEFGGDTASSPISLVKDAPVVKTVKP